MSSGKYRQQDVRAARGTTLTAKSWLTEAPLRMLMNNLDPEVAENPHELVVYGGYQIYTTEITSHIKSGFHRMSC